MRLRSFALLPLLALSCASDVDSPELGERSAALTVSGAVSSSCSTTSVIKLSQQIIQVANCLQPNILVKVPDLANFQPGAAVIPYMQKPAVEALTKVLNGKSGTSMVTNSMLRTIASQYLLYKWSQASKCGIGIAASVGKSNHESGLAIDISNYSTWKTSLEANQFKWYGSGDEVHFDFKGSGTVSLLKTEILAFQKLWNLNNPSDKLTEDGLYGPQTEKRLEKSPAEGFAQVLECGDLTDSDGDGVSDGKDNCPNNKNTSQSDADGDKKGDACDDDGDNDGVANTADNCPNIANDDQADSDKDGQGDACDKDNDNDGVNDDSDNCLGLKNTEQSDNDDDGKGDACDDDNDNDGAPDDTDNCPLVANANQKDSDGDGQGDACEGDEDGDGVIDDKDNCPSVKNPDQSDADGDKKGDACESDADEDGVPDDIDTCPADPDPEQIDSDNDGIGDACDIDLDGDGVVNDLDTCPEVASVVQKDTDKDGQGDACDDDKDGDGVPNESDNCPDLLNDDQADTDGDGKGDACDAPGSGSGGSGGAGGSGEEDPPEGDPGGDLPPEEDPTEGAGGTDTGEAGSNGTGGKAVLAGNGNQTAKEPASACGCAQVGSRSSGGSLVALGAALLLTRSRKRRAGR